MSDVTNATFDWDTDRHPYIADCEHSGNCSACGNYSSHRRHRKPYAITREKLVEMIPECEEFDHQHGR